MPSLRKRATKAEPVADGGPIPAPVVDAALADAARAADAAPPNVETTGAAMAEQQVPDDAHDLRAQLDELRRAERQAQRAQDVQEQIAQQMGPRDTAPAVETGAQTQTARPQLTQAEMAVERVYPQLLTDPILGQVASATISDLAQRGIQRGTADYEIQLRPTFENLLTRSRQRAAPPPPPPAPVYDEPPEPRGPPMSAPVSRSVPTGDFSSTPSKVTLSAQEREHARLAGVPEIEYAKQKLRLQALKASGFYREEG